MKKKIVISFLLCSILIFMISTQVKAYGDVTPVYPYKFSRGVSNTCYYIDSSASTYINRIRGAANNWEVTGYGYNPIYMTEVSSNSGTHMDLYGRNDDWFGDENIVGLTILYNVTYTPSGNQIENWVDPNNSNWFFAAIYLDIDDFPLLTVGDQQGTVIHEMGHAFGLKEYNTNPYSIMYPNVENCMTTVVAECDHNAINVLY